MLLNELILKLQELQPLCPVSTEVEVDTQDINIEDVVLNTDNDYDVVLIK